MVVLRDKLDTSKDYGYSIISPHFSLPFWSSSCHTFPSATLVCLAPARLSTLTGLAHFSCQTLPTGIPSRGNNVPEHVCVSTTTTLTTTTTTNSSNANHTLELERMAADDCWLRVAMTALALDQARACRVWYLLFPCPPCCPNGPYGKGPLA